MSELSQTNRVVDVLSLKEGGSLYKFYKIMNISRHGMTRNAEITGLFILKELLYFVSFSCFIWCSVTLTDIWRAKNARKTAFKIPSKCRQKWHNIFLQNKSKMTPLKKWYQKWQGECQQNASKMIQNASKMLAKC